MSGSVLAGVRDALCSALSAGPVDPLADGAALLREVALVGEVRALLAGVENHLIAAVESARLDGEYAGTKTAAELLGQVQTLAPAVARERVDVAMSVTGRRALTGEPLPPLFPALAAACDAGRVSGEQASVIVWALDKTPHWLNQQQVDTVEGSLLDAARQLHPAALRRFAGQLLARLEQDGPEPPPDPGRERDRSLRLRPNPDGSARLTGLLSIQVAAELQTVLDALAAPAPAEDGTPDPRTADQRRHDAFGEVLRRLLRSGSLPDAGGTPLTVLLTCTVAE